MKLAFQYCVCVFDSFVVDEFINNKPVKIRNSLRIVDIHNFNALFFHSANARKKKWTVHIVYHNIIKQCPMHTSERADKKGKRNGMTDYTLENSKRERKDPLDWFRSEFEWLLWYHVFGADLNGCRAIDSVYNFHFKEIYYLCALTKDMNITAIFYFYPGGVTSYNY